MDTVRAHVYPAALDAAHHGKVVSMIPGRHNDEPCVYVRWWNEPATYRHVTRNPDGNVRAAFHLSITQHAHQLAQQRGITT